MNVITLIGNVGNPPELKTLEGGTVVANLSLATTEYWNDEHGKQSRTTWHHIQTFKPAFVNVIKNYVKKGSKLAINGSYQSRDWETKEGERRRMYYVNIDSIELLDSKPTDQPGKPG
jgi:single-strand DNA-binding protein